MTRLPGYMCAECGQNDMVYVFIENKTRLLVNEAILYVIILKYKEVETANLR